MRIERRQRPSEACGAGVWSVAVPTPRLEDPPLTDATDQQKERVNTGAGGPTPARSTWILLAGAVFGLALAAWGLLEERRDSLRLPREFAALVGERTIRLVDYQRVLAGVENDLRNPVDEALRRRVLERMIDEELLVQRALDLGLAVVDRRVRGELTSGLIDSIVSEADAQEPTDQEIRRHYEENVDFFTRPGRMRAQTLFFANRNSDQRADAAERAQQAVQRLRQPGGSDPAEIARIEVEVATPQVSPLPDALLPASKLRDYVGPTILKELEELEIGEWSSPIESGSGFVVARLLDREAAIVPPLSEVEALVRQDLKRRRGDEGLRRYLDELRSETEVLVNEEIFE